MANTDLHTKIQYQIRTNRILLPSESTARRTISTQVTYPQDAIGGSTVSVGQDFPPSQQPAAGS